MFLIVSVTLLKINIFCFNYAAPILHRHIIMYFKNRNCRNNLITMADDYKT